MYQVLKRDGKVAEFDLQKISDAIKLAFDENGIIMPHQQVDVHVQEKQA